MTVQIEAWKLVLWCSVAVGAYFLSWAVFRVLDKCRSRRREWNSRKKEFLDSLPGVWREIYFLLESHNIDVRLSGLYILRYGNGKLPTINIRLARTMLYYLGGRPPAACDLIMNYAELMSDCVRQAHGQS